MLLSVEAVKKLFTTIKFEIGCKTGLSNYSLEFLRKVMIFCTIETGQESIIVLKRESIEFSAIYHITTDLFGN